MKIKNLFKSYPQLKSRAFLAPLWWSLGVGFYPGAVFSLFVLSLPLVAIGFFFLVLSWVPYLSLGELRPFLISESFLPLIIIALSLGLRQALFVKARKEKKDQVPGARRLLLLRLTLFVRLFLLIAAVPLILNFMLGLDEGFVWLQKYINQGPYLFFKNLLGL
jgi:hypothetical protein